MTDVEAVRFLEELCLTHDASLVTKFDPGDSPAQRALDVLVAALVNVRTQLAEKDEALRLAEQSCCFDALGEETP